jgi:hypothetical protein
MDFYFNLNGMRHGAVNGHEPKMKFCGEKKKQIPGFHCRVKRRMPIQANFF